MQKISKTCITAALLLIAGCGGDWGTVSGTVTVDGQALDKGMVTFEPVGGGATAYGMIKQGGTFQVMTGATEGLKTGEYLITVVDQTIPKDSTESATILTPIKYAATKTSELKATIKAGRNSVDLPLKK